MIKGEDWKDIHSLISASTVGLNQMDNFLIELCKFMNLQINKLEKDNKKIKRELNKIKVKMKDLDCILQGEDKE